MTDANPSNEMIERAKHALVLADTTTTKTGDEWCGVIVCAVMKAMREPTEAMISAAVPFKTKKGSWQAMIDEARKGGNDRMQPDRRQESNEDAVEQRNLEKSLSE